MQLPKYGSWEPDSFYQVIIGMSPVAECSEIEILQDVEDLKKRGHYTSFKEAFIQFLLDDSMTIAQKGEIYLDGTTSSDFQAWKYFQFLWNIIAPGEPWPLEGRPAPEKK